MKHSLARIVVAIAALAALSACGGAGGNPGNTQSGAANQFATERAGTGAPTPAGATAPDVAMANTIAGQIQQIDGNKVVVNNPMGSSVTLELTQDTKIQKQVQGAKTDLQAGTAVTVMGNKQNDIFQAIDVQIGGEDLIGGSLMPAGGALPPGSGPDMSSAPIQPGQGAPAGGLVGAPAGAPMGDLPIPMSGTIEKIDGNTMVLKTKDGNTVNVALTDQTIIHKLADTNISDLKPGTMVVAKGNKSANSFQVTSLQILPAPFS
jgi:uncharacterized protein DUF5666